MYIINVAMDTTVANLFITSMKQIRNKELKVLMSKLFINLRMR